MATQKKRGTVDVPGVTQMFDHQVQIHQVQMHQVLSGVHDVTSSREEVSLMEEKLSNILSQIDDLPDNESDTEIGDFDPQLSSSSRFSDFPCDPDQTSSMSVGPSPLAVERHDVTPTDGDLTSLTHYVNDPEFCFLPGNKFYKGNQTEEDDIVSSSEGEQDEINITNNPLFTDYVTDDIDDGTLASFFTVDSSDNRFPAIDEESARESTDDAGNDDSKECSICFEIIAVMSLSCCKMMLCDTCLMTYIETEVGEGRFDVTCPSSTCIQTLPGGVIIKTLKGDNLDLYKNHLVSKDPSKKKCPRCNLEKELGIFLLRDNWTEEYADYGLKLRCSGCSLIWCFICHAPWHRGLSCEDYRQGDRLMKKWANKQQGFNGSRNAQNCPKCKIWIQKMYGCNHITCTKCKYGFCYRCQGEWSSNGHICGPLKNQVASFLSDPTKSGIGNYIQRKKRKRVIEKRVKVYEKIEVTNFDEKEEDKRENLLKSRLSSGDLTGRRDISNLCRATRTLYSYTMYK